MHGLPRPAAHPANRPSRQPLSPAAHPSPAPPRTTMWSLPPLRSQYGKCERTQLCTSMNLQGVAGGWEGTSSQVGAVKESSGRQGMPASAHRRSARRCHERAACVQLHACIVAGQSPPTLGAPHMFVAPWVRWAAGPPWK